MQAPTPSPTPFPPVEGLQDIALPAPVPYVPQTAVWHVLFVVILALALWGFTRYRRRRAVNLYRRQALVELDALVEILGNKGGRHLVAARLPELLKRVALQVEPRPAVASLTGVEWLAELDRLYGGQGFTKGPGVLLPRLAYGTPAFISGVPRAEIDALMRLSREWIERHRRVAA
jgi:Ca-activated chloride channel family protein